MRFDFQGKFSVEDFGCKFNRQREREIWFNLHLFFEKSKHLTDLSFELLASTGLVWSVEGAPRL